MAEVTLDLSIDDVTWTIEDGTATPKTYTMRATEGTIVLREGKRETVWSMDASGARVGSRDGAPTRFAQLELTGCYVKDVGDNTSATAINIVDIIRQSGYVGSTWKSTADTLGGDPTTSPTVIERKRFKHKITVRDRNSTSGTTKGSVYVLTNMDVLEGYEVTMSRGMWKVTSATFESDAIGYTGTRNT